MATFKVTAKKGNKPVVKRFTVVRKETNKKTLHDLCKRLGFYDITITEEGLK